MHDLARMRKGNRIGHFHQNFEVFLDRVFADELVPRSALHMLHGIEDCALFVASQVVNRDDVGMLQVAGDHRFGQEFLALKRLLLAGFLQHLQGDDAADRLLPRGIDNTHTAFAQLFEQAVVDALVGRQAGLTLTERPRLNHQRLLEAFRMDRLRHRAAGSQRADRPSAAVRLRRDIGHRRFAEDVAAVPHFCRVVAFGRWRRRRSGAEEAGVDGLVASRRRRRGAQKAGIQGLHHAGDFAAHKAGLQCLHHAGCGAAEKARVDRAEHFRRGCGVGQLLGRWRPATRLQRHAGSIDDGAAGGIGRLQQRTGAAFDHGRSAGGRHLSRFQGAKVDGGRANIADREFSTAGRAIGRRHVLVVECVTTIRAVAHRSFSTSRRLNRLFHGWR